MNLLLDTHIALWAFQDDARLSSKARNAILDPETVPFLSVVSLWEIAIKHALARSGRHDFPVSAAQAVEAAGAAHFVLVPVKTPHILSLEALPAHHNDPFDRLLVATALAEPFRLLTGDARLADYGPFVLVA